MKFLDMVDAYRNSVTNVVILASKFEDDSESFEGRVLLHKLEKYKNNPRSQAKYLTLWVRECSHIPLPEKVKTMARQNNLRYKKDYGVGYLHVDGTYHWFEFH